MMGAFIRDSILISAYDIHHGLFRHPERSYRDKELVFIDSGGYELIRDFDSTEPKQTPYEPKDFTEDDCRKIPSDLPPNLPFVVASALPVALGNSGCTCGALSGAVVAGGLFLGTSRPGRGDDMGALNAANLVHDRFTEELGAT
jgi:hypothetical protein